MKVVFFEVQPWEKDSLAQSFPQAVLTTDKLGLDTISICKDAEIISTFITSHLDKQVIDALPNLKFVATRSTGFDHVDCAYCKEKNIVVSNVPEYGSNTVAEQMFALLLSLTRKLQQAIEEAKNLEFDHKNLMGVDLNGKTLGIIGLGKIGTNVLKIAKGFGMNVLVYAHSQHEELKQQLGFDYATLDDLLAKSDVVTLHTPLTSETKHMINKENILKMKQNSFLINTARGGLIDTQAIVLGLEKSILAGVGLDVLEDENELDDEVSLLTNSQNVENLKSLLYDHVLLHHPKVIITPHNAFNSREAVQRITDMTIENIKAFSDGHPQNIVG